MKKIKLITDSSCDLPVDIIDKYNVGIIGLNVSFGEESYIGGVEIDNQTFYKRMREEKDLPKTSCPSPDRFMDLYNCDEESVLVITLSSKLSATYSTAVLAKDMYISDYGQKDIRVMDSTTGSIGAGLLLIRAGQMIEEGKNIDEIVSEIERMRDEIVFFGALETLENAIKGGRINPLAGKLINALNFKVIIHVADGLVKPVDKARGEQGSLKKVLEKMNNGSPNMSGKILAIGHSNCPEKALKVKSMMEENHQFEDVIISEVGSVMGAYTSEGAILVGVL